MAGSDSIPQQERHAGSVIVLGVDTCGPSGSVALGRVGADREGEEAATILGLTELEGRSYSATLVSAIGDLLQKAGLGIADVGCLVAVSGPGSFTGVRVGLSAAKGLADAAGMPIVAVSRLAVLAAKAEVGSAALDAHRDEVFLRLALPGAEAAESLAGARELAGMEAPEEIAVCDDAAERMIEAAWAGVRLVRVEAPSAADAIRLAAGRVLAGKFEDPLLLDGHYLRRSDAEIFGEKARAART